MGQGLARAARAAIVGVTAFVAVTCVQSNVVECDDGTICPEGTTCVIATGRPTVCTTPAQVCGNGRVDLSLFEECDEGVPRVGGDGCSSTCTEELALWRDVTPGVPPGARIGYAFARDPGGGVMLHGGGVGSATPSIVHAAAFSDTWRWRGGAWTRLDPPLDAPIARAQMAFAHDPRRGRVVMFGGLSIDGVSLGDTWEWDGLAWRDRGVAGPSPRHGASLACDAARCILFGGISPTKQALDDVWAWDGATWSDLTPMFPVRPSARMHAAMIYDEEREVIVLFGGETSTTQLADTWELGAAWTPISVPTQPTFNLAYPAIGAYDRVRREVVVITGGRTWIYDGEGWSNPSATGVSGFGAAWSEEEGRVLVTDYSFGNVRGWDGAAWSSTSHASPVGDHHLAATYDARRGRTVVVDHRVVSPQRFATWEWDGAGFQKVMEATTPAALMSAPPLGHDAAIAYDAACGDVIHVGGLGPRGGETWSYRDGAWTQLAVTGPPPRRDHAMTYDPARSAIVVFGGRDAADRLLGDGWELHGACDDRQWAPIAGPGPGPRAAATLAYDPEQRVSVLFGGESDDGPLDETWTLDGSTWTRRSPLLSPPPRAGHGATLHPRVQRVAVVGGAQGAVKLDDTWEWHGQANTWRVLQPLIQLPGRSDFVLAADVTGNILAVGGQELGASSSPRPYRLGYESATPSERCRLHDADGDGDGLAGCDDPDCRFRCAPLCALDTPLAACPAPRCGDGVADPTEDYLICPADVPPP